jgi:hypothetical protein
VNPSPPRTSDDDPPPEPGSRGGSAVHVRDDDGSPGQDGDEAVGYGRPPRASRFQPGRSGNPKGRPRGSVAFKTLLERELAVSVAVKEQGRRRTLSKRGVIVKRLVSEAMAGNPKHLAIVLAQDPVAAEVLDAVTAALTRPADAAVKADLIERLRAAVSTKQASPILTNPLVSESQEGSP